MAGVVGKLTTLMFAAVSLACVLVACGEHLPVRAEGDGEAVRIAALSPAIAVMLRDVGAEDRIVARHGWDLALEKSVPVAGDQTGLDYEALLRARPTHVLLEWGSRPVPARLADLAAARGWEVHNYRLLTLEDVRAAARELHEMFRSEAGLWEETELARRMERAFAKREGVERAGRILLLHSASPPSALGPGSAHQQVLEAIGGRPAITEGSTFVTMDLEDVLRLAPDGIVLIGSGRGNDSPTAGAKEKFGRIAALDIPAVRDGKLAVIEHPLSALPSTSLVEIADRLAEVLEGWAQEANSGGQGESGRGGPGS